MSAMATAAQVARPETATVDALLPSARPIAVLHASLKEAGGDHEPFAHVNVSDVLPSSQLTVQVARSAVAVQVPVTPALPLAAPYDNAVEHELEPAAVDPELVDPAVAESVVAEPVEAAPVEDSVFVTFVSVPEMVAGLVAFDSEAVAVALPVAVPVVALPVEAAELHVGGYDVVAQNAVEVGFSCLQK